MNKFSYYLSTALIAANLLSFSVPTAAIAQSTAAAEKSAIELTSVAEMEKIVKKSDGTSSKERVPMKSALPGDEVYLLNRFKNISQKPTNNLVMTNPIPQNTQLVQAFGAGSQITYSIDGGKSFDASEKLRINGADGKSRSAREEDYTHVRWVIAGNVNPGQVGEVGLRVRVK